MKKFKGNMLTDKSPSGDMLYGTETEKERKERNKKYKENNLNETVSLV